MLLLSNKLLYRRFHQEISLRQGIVAMRYQLFFLFTVLTLGVAPLAMAESTAICSQQAIEEANTQYLRDLSSYISEFTNQQNQAAVNELSRIRPKEAFKRKHAQEIKQFNTPHYQPSIEFCEDVYANLEDLKQQINDIIHKYDLVMEEA